MDSDITTTLNTITLAAWTRILGTDFTYVDSSGSTVYVGPAQFLGYGGAALSMFLSCVGVYQAVVEIISDLEEGQDDFL